jgi:hypothetical protein
VPVKEHEIGLQNVQALAPTYGWNPGGKGKPQQAKRPHRGQPGFKGGHAKSGENRNRNHGSGDRPHGQPKSAGNSWMKRLGNNQRPSQKAGQ